MSQKSLNCVMSLLAVMLLVVSAGCPDESGTGSGEAGSGSPDGSGTTKTGGESGSSGTSNLEGRITIDGSSTVEPISKAVAVAFKEKYPSVKVTVGISGTGGGFKRFDQGETDISNASRPIKASEFQRCRENKVDFIEIPVAYDGLSIVVNSKNDFVEKLTVADLKSIFLAPGAKTWKEVNDAWPDATIKVYAPGKDSGTYDYFFNDVVNSDEAGQPRSERVSFNEDDNGLVDGVAREQYAIGFFGCAYFFANEERLKAVPIVNPETGAAIVPTAATIESGEYAPFSRPLFIYLNTKSLESPAMKQFVEFYLSNAARMADKVGYVALPDSIYERAYSNYENMLTGTHYLTPELEKRTGPLDEVYVEENRLPVIQ